MSFQIRITEGEIELIDSSSQNDKRFTFNLSSTVNMTDIIHYISDRDQKIVCQPASLDEFKIENEAETPDILKLVEYIYKIINAFNESYTEIFSEEIIA